MVDEEERLNGLKKHVFYELLDLAGRVMVMVKYSPDVIIGNRGFVGEEKESGIILVFNPKMKFSWDGRGISATLVFGAAPQKCFIPSDSIAAIYSPELNTQFVTAFQEKQAAEDANEKKTEPGTKGAGHVDKNVISVDFIQKKKV